MVRPASGSPGSGVSTDVDRAVVLAAEQLCGTIGRGAFVTDASGRHIHANRPMIELLGGQPTRGAAPPGYIPRDQHRHFWQTLEENEHRVDGGPLGSAIEFELDAGERILAAVDLFSRSVDGHVCTVWTVSEAYAYDPGRGFDGGSIPTSPSDDGREEWPPEAPNRPVRALAPREQEVILALLAGNRVGAIGRRFGISSNTVRNHMKSIFRKLNVHSQQEAIDRYRPISLPPVPPPPKRDQRDGAYSHVGGYRRQS